MQSIVTKVIAIVLILAMFSYTAYMIGVWIYGQGYQNGYNSSFYTLRVTHVEPQQDDTYLIMIRDRNDELYTHYCYR